MARQRKEYGGGGGGEWLNTYADMVTLLLTFFILLFSMSSLDAAKFNMLVKAFASDDGDSETLVIVGSPEGSPEGVNRGADSLEEIMDDISELYEQLKKHVEENNLSSSVEVSKGDNYVFISFSDNMLFEPNSARLKPADMEILNFVGYGIKSVQDEAEMILVNGHTAEIVEDPNYPVSDRLLSSNRADAVLMHFEDVIGIDSKKLISVAYGKNHPVADNGTPEGMSRNRRVEIIISTENVLTSQLDAIYEKLRD